MERQTRKNLGKIKKDTAEFFSKLKVELPLALLLGTGPMLIFCSTERDVDEMLSGLLAIGPLIKYSVILTLPYFLIQLIKYGIRFSYDSSRAKLDYIHNIINEVGPGFLTISRTALGAVLGIIILLHTTHIITASTKLLVSMYGNALFFLAFNCAHAMLKDRATLNVNPRREKNPIQLPKKLK
ncbi:hypothetical protein [Pseudomonas putida]|uniref:Uncharacterized protein n=1 Tax=Pseudomonas putida TaxID=303 RepID=A0A1X0ZSD5_PSEPU|nr:hypothetical protein [Pseudomonas putida]ORL62373.1 hypothetical protein B7H17_18290 [Pseudomonas putida]